MTRSVVSIIVPVYNTPRDLLFRAMRSLLTQSFEGLEIVLVDYGNEVDSALECDCYAAVDPRVKVIHQHNQGVSAARNAGIEASNAPWIMFVDPDDELLPGALEEAVNIAERNELDILYATEIDSVNGVFSQRKMGFEVHEPLRIIEETADLFKLAEYFAAYETPADSHIPKALSTGPVARLFKRATIGDVKFDTELTIMEDAIFNSKVVLKAHKVGLLDKPWYIYYRNSASAVHLIDFSSLTQGQRDVVRFHVEASGLPYDAYYSWICSYFFMAASSMLRRGELNVASVREGLSLPWFGEAFSHIDLSHFYYQAKDTLPKYRLACGGHAFLLVQFLRCFAPARQLKHAATQRLASAFGTRRENA